MEDFTERLVRYLDAFEEALVLHTPAAVEFALLYARLDAAQGLLVWVLLSIVAFVAGHTLSSRWRAYLDAEYARWAREDRPDELASTRSRKTLAYSTYIPFVVFFTFGVCQPWRWIGMFAPEVWIVHRLIG